MKARTRKKPKKTAPSKKRIFLTFLISFLIVSATAFIGSLFTGANTKSQWYYENRPSFTPPNFVFPIAWTILFTLIAVSMALSWISARPSQKSKVAFGYGLNLFLNMMWSFLFFFMRLPRVALVGIVLLWCSIWWLVVFNWRISRAASWLIAPYLIWVTFATFLNLFFII